jgi:hypothetical protein
MSESEDPEHFVPDTQYTQDSDNRDPEGIVVLGSTSPSSLSTSDEEGKPSGTAGTVYCFINCIKCIKIFQIVFLYTVYNIYVHTL